MPGNPPLWLVIFVHAAVGLALLPYLILLLCRRKD